MSDHSQRAATITDDLIERSQDVLGPEDRDPLRTVLQIAFEVQASLSPRTGAEKTREWTQETVCAGCEFALLARIAWRAADQVDGLSSALPEEDCFPANLHVLREQLDEALRTVSGESMPLGARLRAVNRVARLQILFLGATLW